MRKRLKKGIRKILTQEQIDMVEWAPITVKPMSKEAREEAFKILKEAYDKRQKGQPRLIVIRRKK